MDINADGSPLTTAQVPRAERNHIHVHYLPARRDPADHIAYGANALLGRMLRAVTWDAERTVIKGLTDQISDSLAANPSINAFSTRLKTAWSALHKGSFFADPKLTFVASEIESLLRHMSVSFTPGHDEQLVDFSRLTVCAATLNSCFMNWSNTSRPTHPKHKELLHSTAPSDGFVNKGRPKA